MITKILYKTEISFVKFWFRTKDSKGKAMTKKMVEKAHIITDFFISFFKVKHSF
jgi:hypothetical protein